MANKQFKKMRQTYRRELRDELQHVQVVKREEAEILAKYLLAREAAKPRFLPQFAWSWIIKKVLYK